MPTVFPIVLSRYHCFFLNFWRILLFFGLRSHLFHPWPCKKSENLRIGEKYNPRPFSICFVCVFALFFPIFWWILRYFLASFSPFFLWPCKKSGNLDFGCRLSTAECCWVLRSVLLRNPIPSLFPFVLCVFSHCFDGFCAFFWLRSHLFHPWPCKKSGNLEIGCRLSTAECCWEIQFPSFFPFFVCVFLLFCPEFIVSPICLMDFVLFFGFVLTFFIPDPGKSQETLKLVADWALLSAAGKSNSHPFSISFVCVFPLFCPDFIGFSKLFDGFCIFFGFVLTFFIPDPGKSQETLKLVADWALLSAAECCGVCCWVLLRNPIPSPYSICFVCVCNI